MEAMYVFAPLFHCNTFVLTSNTIIILGVISRSMQNCPDTSDTYLLISQVRKWIEVRQHTLFTFYFSPHNAIKYTIVFVEMDVIKNAISCILCWIVEPTVRYIPSLIFRNLQEK